MKKTIYSIKNKGYEGRNPKKFNFSKLVKIIDRRVNGKELCDKVKHLFEEKPFIEGLRSTLERIPIPKQVFVDNADDPQTAVIVVFRHCDLQIILFFGGRADNEEFKGYLCI